MKNRTLKWIKKTTSMLVAVVMVASGMMITANAEDETKTENTIQYVVWDDYATYAAGGTNHGKAPVYSDSETQACGYVFGGWFTSSEENKYSPVSNLSSVSSGTVVYAKFVPAYVLSVKCQNKAGTVEGQGTALKIISSLDSKNYSAYGFELAIVSLNNDGTLSKSQPFGEEKDLTAAYRKFAVYSDEDTLVDTYTPDAMFGNESEYFTTWGVSGIGAGSFKTIICVKPYWKTLDGTKVYGLTKYAHVEDGLVHNDGSDFRYINVPVNLRQMSDISGVAAGVLSVQYSDAKTGETLEFAGVEGGRYFEEMAWADKTTSVKLVGNLSSMSQDKNEDDIYANIRFKVRNVDAYENLTDYSFKVLDEDFSNLTETQYSSESISNKYDVWNVKY